MKITKNIPLLIGIALPVIFILAILIIIFTPSFFIKPQYNFLYLDSNLEFYYPKYYTNYSNTYVVVGNRLSLSPFPVIQGVLYKEGNIPMYLYDVKSNSIRQVDWNEAKNFNIDPGPSSPDGYIVKYQYNEVFELFGSGKNFGYTIFKDNRSKKLNGLDSINFKFIGWVK